MLVSTHELVWSRALKFCEIQQMELEGRRNVGEKGIGGFMIDNSIK